jgi:hypothetical protein
MKGWGFNSTTANFGSPYVVPFRQNTSPATHWSLPDHSNPQKWPAYLTEFTSNYSKGSKANQATPDFFHAVDSHRPADYYGGFTFSDIYSDYWNAYLLANLPLYGSQTLREEPWLTGWQPDQTDDTPGLGRGEDFTAPGGIPVHIAYVALVTAPYQAFADGVGRNKYHPFYAVQAGDTCSGLGSFPSGTGCVKKQLVTFLQTKYGTISSLNAAWGSSYSSFFSTATRYTGESVGSGSGPFTHTMAHPPITRGSVVIRVNGTATCGDDVRGIIGPTGTCTGSSVTNYAAGTIRVGSITSGTVTVDYTSNGWGPECSSAALEDEDGRHTGWLGATANYINKYRSGTAAYRADLSAFLLRFASSYFQKANAALKSVFPHTLNLSEYALGSWGIPARPEVYQAASPYIDVLGADVHLDGSVGTSLGYQCPIGYTVPQCIFNYVGDKPLLIWIAQAANPDSEFVGLFSGNGTQDTRGAYFINNTPFHSLRNPNTGSYPFVGYTWWCFGDSVAERNQWGLVTNQDNEYDGVQATATPGTITIGSSTYTKFTERGNFGDMKQYFVNRARDADAGLLSAPDGVPVQLSENPRTRVTASATANGAP